MCDRINNLIHGFIHNLDETASDPELVLGFNFLAIYMTSIGCTRSRNNRFCIMMGNYLSMIF